MRIGIAGLGKMGRVFSEKLLEAGHDLAVWNRSPGPAKEIGEKGARVVAHPAELVSTSEIVITIVSDATALADVFGGANGLASGDMAGTLIVEMSTVAPQTHIDLAKMTEAAGGRFIECPVSGSVAVAREKRLLGFAGGAAGDVERARPMLDGLCRRVDHVGAVGAGAALKLAINLPLIMYWQVLGEALAICEPYGFDPDWLIGLFSESSGGPNVLKVRGPSIAKSLTGEAVPVTADLNTFLKDVGLMLDAAKADGNTSPMVEQARTVFAAAQKRGLGEIDCSAFPAYWAKKGKTELLGSH